MNSDRRIILLATLGVVVLGLMIAQRMITAPHQRQLKQVEEQIQQEDELLRIQQGIAGLWPKIEILQQRLPESVSSDWLTREVARLAEQVNLRLASIEPDVPRGYHQGSMRVAVTVQLDCGYHEVGTLVSLIESSPLYMHVDELEMRPASQLSEVTMQSDPQQAKTHVRMVLSTLSFPPLTVVK